MRIIKQEIYFPIIIGIHFIFWAVDLYFYQGTFSEVSSDTLFFGELTNESWLNVHRILGEVFSSWVVTVFAFNFLMATRARWVEKLFGGLDKMYVIHRRSGVIAVCLLIAHFLIVPRDLVEFSAGKPLGFYALILILLGVIISAAPPIKKKLPYHIWVNIHKLMGFFYVLAVVHGLMVRSLIQELPITRVYVFGMAFLGIAAWIYRAFLYGLFHKKLAYTVQTVRDLGHGFTELTFAETGKRLAFQAGQFAFFTFPSISKREQHPFTISSHPEDKQLRITVKGLGDYTHDLHTKLKAGDPAQIEGPFGHFTPRHVQEQKQIWIAGGIGITPFLSLAKNELAGTTTLYWCVNHEEEAVYRSELMQIAEQQPNLQVIIWDTTANGYLTVDKLEQGNIQEAAFLICGPQTLKDSLIQQLKQKGVSRSRVYDEEFAFR